jgi:hypothetical protein
MGFRMEKELTNFVAWFAAGYFCVQRHEVTTGTSAQGVYSHGLWGGHRRGHGSHSMYDTSLSFGNEQICLFNLL